MPTSAQPVSLFALYRLCFVVGLFSFGGGLTAWFHREVVQVRGWMTDDEFFSGYSLAQILPGVNSTNMAVYIGQHLRGAIGSTAALLGLLTGPFVIVIAAAALYHHLVALPGFPAIMGGVAAAAVGMMFRLGMTSARGAHRHIPSLIVLVATFVAIGVMQWPLLPVLLVLAPLSIAAAWPRKNWPRKNWHPRRRAPAMRDDPLIQLIIVIAPLSLLAIGGASAIYAPLQQQSVDVYQWVSGREYLELFAIARVTPGPGSMLTTLIGWKVAGFLGALVATLALYVPCSVLCFGVARTWNRYRGTKWHTAIEDGLRPIGAGLMIAGGVMILRIESSGWLGWAVAFAVVAVMTWRPAAHPMLLLAIGAAVFVAVRAIAG